jgi:antitoxin PrlF
VNTPRNPCCCNVESLVTVDERGQMVLPKDLRDKANIRPGDKLAVISCEEGGEACCLILIKATELTGMLKNRLGPVFQELVGDKTT